MTLKHSIFISSEWQMCLRVCWCVLVFPFHFLMLNHMSYIHLYCYVYTHMCSYIVAFCILYIIETCMSFFFFSQLVIIMEFIPMICDRNIRNDASPTTSRWRKCQIQNHHLQNQNDNVTAFCAISKREKKTNNYCHNARCK